MPPPATVPAVTFEASRPISNLTIGLDAIILDCWRDTSLLGSSDPLYPYYGMELQISCWKATLSTTNHILARYSGGKLKKDALYQLKGRFVVDNSTEGGKSYLHVDEAVRFQGPGLIRSFKVPVFLLVAVVERVEERGMEVRWVARDPYRRGVLVEQSTVLGLGKGLRLGEEKGLEGEGGERWEGELCCLEGVMEGLGWGDWVCASVRLC